MYETSCRHVECSRHPLLSSCPGRLLIMRIRDVVDSYMFEPWDEMTRTNLEADIRKVFPGEFYLVLRENPEAISICPETPEDATLLALMW